MTESTKRGGGPEEVGAVELPPAEPGEGGATERLPEAGEAPLATATEPGGMATQASVSPAGKPAAPGPSGVSTDELQALQAAEEAKGDPELDEVEAASIAVPEGDRIEPFEKLAARAKRLSPERVRAVTEALLFLAEKPLAPEDVRAASGIETARVRTALDELSGHYREGVSGIVLYEVGGGWQLRSAPDVAEHARRFLRVKPQRLTRAALETLAIIAYRQPVTRPEIEEVRGVDSGAVVKALLERKLIKILGKKEEPGRPLLYGTTHEFLEFFALKDLASLPTLREFHELTEEHREIVEKEAPAEEVPPIAGMAAELADPALRAALASKQAESDAALAELEQAIDAADAKSRAAEAALAPPGAVTGVGEAGAGSGVASEAGAAPEAAPDGGGPTSGRARRTPGTTDGGEGRG